MKKPKGRAGDAAQPQTERTVLTMALQGSTITTDATVRRDLEASLSARRACVGLTWASFKAAVEEGLCVRDDDTLASIEYGVRKAGVGRLVRDDAADGIEIREVGYVQR